VFVGSGDGRRAHLETKRVDDYRLPVQRSAGALTASDQSTGLLLDEGEHFANSVVESDE
jgi:hypothetical protein